MNFKERFEIPAPAAKRTLGVGAAQFQRLIAERVIEVVVKPNGRINTSIESIERADAHAQRQRR